MEKVINYQQYNKLKPITKIARFIEVEDIGLFDSCNVTGLIAVFNQIQERNVGKKLILNTRVEYDDIVMANIGYYEQESDEEFETRKRQAYDNYVEFFNRTTKKEQIFEEIRELEERIEELRSKNNFLFINTLGDLQ